MRESQSDLFRNSKLWFFYGRNFTRLTHAWIAVGRPKAELDGSEHKYVAAYASEVFAALSLDLDQLSQIFVKDPHEYYLMPKHQRPKQPIALNYKSLGCCRVWDEEGWSELAKLLDKNILFYHNHGGNSPENVLRCIYYRNGKCSQINETDWDWATLEIADGTFPLDSGFNKKAGPVPGV